MAGRQRILRVRREYNRWVADQTLEDYALRFTAESARRWSGARVANTALGAVSFLMLEAIGGTVTLGYGFANAVCAILLVGGLILATGTPIAYYAARYGVDMDLLTRGAGFGYLGSTITSLIYASFTFIFFALEAVILASALQDCLGLPQWLGCILCCVAVIPLVTHGITFISRLQTATQPLWLLLNLLPFLLLLRAGGVPAAAWTGFGAAGGLSLLAIGSAGSVVMSLVAQIGEQVDFLRFLPPPRPGRRLRWWGALLAGGPGWILPGMAKLLAGSFLACLAVGAGHAPADAAQPGTMYRVAFGTVIPSPQAALLLTGLLVLLSQIKINVTNAYAGSIAWSNFFSRLTHAHPGRVVWVAFNIAIALLLMELGVYRAIERTLVVFSSVAAAWIGALVADLVVNKPLGLSPPGIEFKRAHLYDINPVGVGAMLLGVLLAMAAIVGAFGAAARALAPFLAFALAFGAAPAIAWVTGGRYYLARRPQPAPPGPARCIVCENAFEAADTAHCPAYAGTICSLCCSLDVRCNDLCRPQARGPVQAMRFAQAVLPRRFRRLAATPLGRTAGVFALFAAVIGALLLGVYAQAAAAAPDRGPLAAAFWQAFLVLMVVAAVVAWLIVLAQASRRAALSESRRQTRLLMNEIRAHGRTDAALQRAKEAAEAANLAKSRYVVGISHELRTPLNAILGYAQLLERDLSIPERRRDGIRIIRRSGEHLAGLIEGLLDISKIEAGRIEVYRDEVRLAEFLDQIVNMFRLQAEAKGIGFAFTRPERLPDMVQTDERRLRQILINLLSNAIKFTGQGSVSLRLRLTAEIAEFTVEDTGPGIEGADLDRIFEPFERARAAAAVEGVGLGLTITRLLVQIMGGEIKVASRPGEGSRFTVRLLLFGREPPRPAPVARQIQGYAGRRRTVLIVDDDPVHRGLVEEVLQPLGFALLQAGSGEEGLRLAAAGPDLFLVDLSMPGMSGWELARRLREGGHPDTPIILVSANAGELAGARGPHHDDALAKPVSLAGLVEKVGALLRLDWIYGEAADVAGPDGPAPPAVLDAGQVAGLRELGSIGYVRGLRARLDELERERPDAAAYLGYLRGLVAEFRMDELLAALDRSEAA